MLLLNEVETKAVKTIILSNIPENKATFKMDYYNGIWNSACTNCIAGFNDFSGADHSYSISLSSLRITFN